MEEDVWSSDLGVSAFSAGGYGSGGYSFMVALVGVMEMIMEVMGGILIMDILMRW